MPVKRSRAGSSSSYLETPASNASAGRGGSVSLVKVMKIADAEPSRPKFLTDDSPVNVAGSDQLKIGGFLEHCHYCKKRISPNAEVFMYSNLCAFCSAECRDFQIALDQLAEKKVENSKEK